MSGLGGLWWYLNESFVQCKHASCESRDMSAINCVLRFYFVFCALSCIVYVFLFRLLSRFRPGARRVGGRGDLGYIESWSVARVAQNVEYVNVWVAWPRQFD